MIKISKLESETKDINKFSDNYYSKEEVNKKIENIKNDINKQEIDGLIFCNSKS